MGSLSVQPPSGLSRNLTEVFNFLRSNAHQLSHLQVGFADGNSDVKFPYYNKYYHLLKASQ